MKTFFIFIIGLFFLLGSCSTLKKVQNIPSIEHYFVVSKIKKQKNNVYIIYAQRHDSIFKIFSHFDGIIKNNDIKLVKGSHFRAYLNSQFKATEEKFNMMPQYEISILFHGVTISKEPENKINDIFSCEELNGKYISQEYNK